MSRPWLLVFALISALPLFAAAPPATSRVGPAIEGGTLVPTGQLVRPAGTSVSFVGRPVDVVLSADGKWLFAKDNRGVVVIHAKTWKVIQELRFPKGKGGGSMHGLAVRDNRLYATTAQRWLHEAEFDDEGQLTWKRAIVLAGPDGKGEAHATGIAVSADGKTAWVCLSRNNSLGVVDLARGKLLLEIPVGVAPYAVVVSKDESTAFVSNWGGRRPRKGDKTADSSGTPAVVDERGVAASGTVGKIDLKAEKMTAEAATGLHPAGMALSGDGSTLFVACANSDKVELIETKAFRLLQSVLVRPDDALPFGSAPNAVTVSPDGKTLAVACGGNNAIALIDLSGPAKKPASLKGFVPVGWYPGAVTCDDKHLYVANVKGEGSRTKQAKGFGVYGFTGTVTKAAWPDAKALATYTAQVKADGRIPQILAARERGDKGVKPVPVPAKVGEPSVFEHVVYVIKENRTYDQVFGDVKKGLGEPKLCIFPREITPNHHALAEEFVLLDNFYCNGVLSADGHSWATEGNVTDHLEKAFGGFTRSYTFGDDPLTYSSSGFLWDAVLLAGRSFRNYGEMRYTDLEPAKATFADVWKQYRTGKGNVKFKHRMGVEPLERHTCPDYAGWNMTVSDSQRIDAFLKEFRAYEKKGSWVDLSILYLPQDHTSGTQPGMPTPRAHVADNDQAVGRLVEAVSNSKFWKKTVIFVIEDDPQDGFDHVDGHRSICLVISPYTRRKAVVSEFYNQTSVLHTMQRILGVPAMNQLDGGAPLMTTCFTKTPDHSVYKLRQTKIPLDEVNKPLKEMSPKDRAWAIESMKQDLTRPDGINEDRFNRILWHAMKGADVPYPTALAGAHGKGLNGLGLRLE